MVQDGGGTGVPDDVADPEPLARQCGHNNVRKSDGRVKWQAFCASRWPFEISVDRMDYCDAWAKIDTRKKRLAVVETSHVRERVSETQVVANKPPPEHAHIEVLIGESTTQFETKADLMAELELFDAHQSVCEKLAELATAPEPPRTAEEPVAPTADAPGFTREKRAADRNSSVGEPAPKQAGQEQGPSRGLLERVKARLASVLAAARRLFDR